MRADRVTGKGPTTEHPQNKEANMTQALGILFFAGIMVAGSDGPWFPWANLAGLAVTAAACWRLREVAK